MNEQDTVLIELLADQDAVFKPYRHQGHLHTAAVYQEHRDAFFSAGLSWASGEPTEAGRKASQREMEICVDRGLVKSLRKQGRTCAVSLTNEGDQRARALAGNPNLADALPILQRMIPLLAESRRYYLEGLADAIPETRLVGVDWGKGNYREELGLLQFMLMPALSRGWVRFNSSMRGHGWYRPCLTEPWKLAEIADNLPDAEPEATDLYDARFKLTSQRLMDALPKDSNSIGIIPECVSFARVGYPGSIHVHGMEGSANGS